VWKDIRPKAAEIIVSNLILNAIQPSRSGLDGMVSVRLRKSREKRAILVVQDFRTGISAQNITRIFHRFFGEDPSRSRETGGFGLITLISSSTISAARATLRQTRSANPSTRTSLQAPTDFCGELQIHHA
jgi:two-component system sensor histidine kinase BaeS